MNFEKLSVVFNSDTSLFKSFLNESISRVTIVNKLFVSINNSESVLRRESTMVLSPFPYFVRNEEVEAFNFTSIGVFRNAEVTITTLEVRNILRIFVLSRSPCFGISVSVNGMFRVFKSFIKTFNL